MPSVAVVILNYNGKDLLKKFLPSVLSHSPGAQVIVADNHSTDESLSYLESEFPAVRIIKLKENYGFARGYNEALKEVVADYFVLLNSDVEVSGGWIEPVISLMENNKTIAAAQPKILSYNKKDEFEYAGACGGFIDKYGFPFCRGRIFNEVEKDEAQYDITREVFWATGACMFVRAEIFQHLKGFDPFYFAHMEEIDLCWRMKNTGNRIMVVPQSVIYHLGGGTLNKISPRKTFLNFRNSLLAMIKNDRQKNLFGRMFWRLSLDGIASFKFLLEGNPRHFWAVMEAHAAFYYNLPRFLRLRKEAAKDLSFTPSSKFIYKRSIVADHYLHGQKKFSGLKEEDFSA